MENRKFSETVAGWVGTSEGERGIRLGILAGGVALILLFGSGALVQQTPNTVDFDQGQYVGLLVRLGAGFVVLLFALILAYYAGLSAPEAKTGEATRGGMLAGALTMLLFWVGQSIFALVESARAPQGLQLDGFLRDRLIAGLGFFVVGGLFGWWGYRSALRRSRSIFLPPGVTFPLTSSSGPLVLPDTQRSTAKTSHTPEPAPSSLELEQPAKPEQSAELGNRESSSQEELRR
jgi:hypothetical protein